MRSREFLESFITIQVPREWYENGTIGCCYRGVYGEVIHYAATSVVQAEMQIGAVQIVLWWFTMGAKCSAQNGNEEMLEFTGSIWQCNPVGLKWAVTL